MNTEATVEVRTAFVLFMFLFVGISAEASRGEMTIRVSSLPGFRDSLSLTCTVPPGVPDIVNIHLGKKVPDGKGGHQDKVLANVGSYRKQGNEEPQAPLIVDTLVDRTGTTASRVIVSMRKVSCKDEGTYYCDVTTESNVNTRTEAQISICNNISEVVHAPMNEANPTHTLVTCRLASNPNVKSISSMEIVWQGETLVSANVTANNGRAVRGSALAKARLIVTGQVIESRPGDSQLVVEFPSQTCEDVAVGRFACHVRYSAINLSITQFAYSALQTSKPCDKDYPGISVSQATPYIPTSFGVACGPGKQPSGTLVSLEISFVSDTSPQVRRQVAYLDRFSSGKNPQVSKHLKNKGVIGSAGDNFIKVSFNAGSCEDSGVYRCQAVYQPTGETGFKVKISEARLPSCLPGALATVVKAKAKGGRQVETFVCHVQPTLHVQLIGLEISVVRKASRQVLAYINRLMNDGKVSYVSEDVRAVGRLINYDLVSSSLNMTSSTEDLQGTSLYTTTCKAVFSTKDGKSHLMESMTDTKFGFRNN